MATEKWINGSGQGLAWGGAMGSASINSLPQGSGVMSTLDITNGSILDIFADFSVSLGSITTVAPGTLGVYTYYLNQDATTYGDNQFGSGTQVAKTPANSSFVGNIVFPIGTQVCVGLLRGIVLFPGTFRWLILNNTGVPLAASANTLQYRTYNRSVA